MLQESVSAVSTPTSSVIGLAGRWFLESGIQESSGGVARYYRSDTGRNNPVSTEITGYTASVLVYLSSVTGNPAYLDAARRAGRFLTRTAWDPALAAFPFEHPAELAYFFDSGIIVRGLLSLWRATGDSEFLDTARTAGFAMARDFGTGSEVPPILSLPRKLPIPRAGGWSRNPGCYQLKSALAWYELFLETGDESFHRLYHGLLEYALRSHAGFLPGDGNRERVMDRLHAYSYFLEGLLPSAGQPECAQALAEGIDRTSRYLRDIAPVLERSDVYAQLLRARLLADQCGAVPLDRTAAGQEAAAIVEFQMGSADPRIHGGFCFGRKPEGLLPFVNPVSTAFCVQALDMWQQYQTGGLKTAWQSLI
jgi:hypothetical protein